MTDTFKKTNGVAVPPDFSSIEPTWTSKLYDLDVWTKAYAGVADFLKDSTPGAPFQIDRQMWVDTNGYKQKEIHQSCFMNMHLHRCAYITTLHRWVDKDTVQ